MSSIKTYLGVFIFLVMCMIESVNSQICQRTKIVATTRLSPVTYTYRATYRDKCWYGQCTKSRVQIRIVNRSIRVTETAIEKKCCPGYIQDETVDVLVIGINITCIAVCSPPCNNGECREPGKCVCNDGYIFKSGSSRECVPVCSTGCEHGTCVGPNTCQCNFGYALHNETCSPVCSERCENGLCIAPDTCECLDGYRKSDDNICEPYCFNGCVNGKCIQPQTCECDPGFKKSSDQCVPECNDCSNGICTAPGICTCNPGYEYSNGTCQPNCLCNNGQCVVPNVCAVCNPGYSLQNTSTCEPICTENCGMGLCSAPDTCECDDGYEITEVCDPFCCVPSCYTACQHGKCVEPDICECNVGYTINEDDDKCIPDCNNCGNGTCLEPNVCECNLGYKLNETMGILNESLCVPMCQNCEGTCLQPNACVCDSPYETRNERADGGECDCFGNCSDSIKCERTICVLRNDTNTPSIPIRGGSDWTVDEIEKTSTDRHFNYIDAVTDTDSNVSNDSFNSDDDSDDAHDYNISEIAKQEKTKDSPSSNYSYIWVYIVAAVIVGLFIIMTVILVTNRHRVSSFFSGGSYVVQDHPSNEDCAAPVSPSLRFSSLARKDV